MDNRIPPAAQATDVKTFDRDALTPTGGRDAAGNETYLGPDGRTHYPGDAVDTARNSAGRLVGPDNRTFVTDPSPPTRTDLDVRHSTQDHRSHVPDQDTRQDAALRDQVDARNAHVAARDDVYNDKIAPHAEKFADSQLPLDKNTTRSADRARNLSDLGLSPADRHQVEGAMKTLVTENRAIKTASEHLGIAGGNLTVAREFPDAQRLTGGTLERGTPGTLDSALVARDKFIALEEKGVTSDLGSRSVPNLAAGDGSHHRAEQGHTDYLHAIVERDPQLAKALDADPALRQHVATILASGNPDAVRYLLVRTQADGTVNVADFKIDIERLLRTGIQLPRRHDGTA